jgi:hypothetical protein
VSPGIPRSSPQNQLDYGAIHFCRQINSCDARWLPPPMHPRLIVHLRLTAPGNKCNAGMELHVEDMKVKEIHMLTPSLERI